MKGIQVCRCGCKYDNNKLQLQLCIYIYIYLCVFMCVYCLSSNCFHTCCIVEIGTGRAGKPINMQAAPAQRARLDFIFVSNSISVSVLPQLRSALKQKWNCKTMLAIKFSSCSQILSTCVDYLNSFVCECECVPCHGFPSHKIKLTKHTLP